MASPGSLGVDAGRARDALLMTSVLLVIAVAVLARFIFSYIQRNRRQLVPQRGTSVGADLGAMSDLPRVRVESVVAVGPGLVRVMFTPEAGESFPSPDLDIVVSLGEDEFGFEQLHEWKRSGAALAVVFPPNSRLVRLRSVDDLQPLTLSRAEP